MALLINDINTLTDVEVVSETAEDLVGDVRSTVLFTRAENVDPFILRAPEELLAKNILADSKTYKQAQSIFSQNRKPKQIIFYGNKVAQNFTDVIKAYKNHADTKEAFIWALPCSLKTEKEFAESVISYAKTDKSLQVLLGIETEELTSIDVLTTFSKSNPAANVALFAEGTANAKAGNYLFAAVAGGVTGAKTPGSYITHSSQITGFKQETFTIEEQTKLIAEGLNYLSRPAGGLFHLVNGMNTDKKTYTENVIEDIWFRENLKITLISILVLLDKIDMEDAGRNLIYATINSVIAQAYAMGIVRAINGNYFAEYREKDGTLKRLGKLEIGTLTEENLRKGNWDIKLFLSRNNGTRSIALTVKITKTGILIY